MKDAFVSRQLRRAMCKISAAGVSLAYSIWMDKMRGEKARLNIDSAKSDYEARIQEHKMEEDRRVEVLVEESRVRESMMMEILLEKDEIRHEEEVSLMKREAGEDLYYMVQRLHIGGCRRILGLIRKMERYRIVECIYFWMENTHYFLEGDAIREEVHHDVAKNMGRRYDEESDEWCCKNTSTWEEEETAGRSWRDEAGEGREGDGGEFHTAAFDENERGYLSYEAFEEKARGYLSYEESLRRKEQTRDNLYQEVLKESSGGEHFMPPPPRLHWLRGYPSDVAPNLRKQRHHMVRHLSQTRPPVDGNLPLPPVGRPHFRPGELLFYETMTHHPFPNVPDSRSMETGSNETRQALTSDPEEERAKIQAELNGLKHSKEKELSQLQSHHRLSSASGSGGSDGSGPPYTSKKMPRDHVSRDAYRIFREQMDRQAHGIPLDWDNDEVRRRDHIDAMNISEVRSRTRLAALNETSPGGYDTINTIVIDPNLVVIDANYDPRRDPNFAHIRAKYLPRF